MLSKRVFFPIAGLLLFLFVASVNATCYVKWDAAGSNNGTSWNDAFVDLQTALGTTACQEIWVGRGTYRPSTTDRTASFNLPSGVVVYGGFAGVESSMDQRYSSANRSILSGDIGNDDVHSAGDDIDGSADDIRNENSYHVVTT